MKNRFFSNASELPQYHRALLGFLFGLIVMGAAVQVFTVNSFDFDNMERGVRMILSGVNPWALATRMPHYYNPPFAVLFLWPMLFTSPKIMLVLGGALLFGLVFAERSWAALGWFLTNTMLWIMAAGGVDMYLIGAGLLCLLAGDRHFQSRRGLVLRVMAYGFLMVKPQGGIFIVALYLLLRCDWKGMLVSVIVYGLPFLWLYPDWLQVLASNPPLAQTEAAHTLLGKFGPFVALLVALLILMARRWRFWHLGGALAGILMPYGMPGLPIFLTLCAVRRTAIIPATIIFSALLASVTWINPPDPSISYYAYVNPLMSIYHLSMLGLSLILAVYLGGDESGQSNTIALCDWLREVWHRFRPIRPSTMTDLDIK